MGQGLEQEQEPHVYQAQENQVNLPIAEPIQEEDYYSLLQQLEQEQVEVEEEDVDLESYAVMTCSDVVGGV